MAIDFHALLRRDKVRIALGPDKFAEALKNEDFLSDTICEDGNDVVTLAWDGDFPGGSGANYIREWNGLYFFSSSDHEEEGPFESLDEALWNIPTCVRLLNPSLTLPFCRWSDYWS